MTEEIRADYASLKGRVKELTAALASYDGPKKGYNPEWVRKVQLKEDLQHALWSMESRHRAVLSDLID